MIAKNAHGLAVAEGCMKDFNPLANNLPESVQFQASVNRETPRLVVKAQ
jgi:hypothetical protein